jgi:hypothetical protein
LGDKTHLKGLIYPYTSWSFENDKYLRGVSEVGRQQKIPQPLLRDFVQLILPAFEETNSPAVV